MIIDYHNISLLYGSSLSYLSNPFFIVSHSSSKNYFANSVVQILHVTFKWLIFYFVNFIYFLLFQREGCKKWSIDKIEPHLIDIWLCLKKELLPGNDADVRNSATETLTSLINKLNDLSNDKNISILTSFVEDIISSKFSYLFILITL